MKKSKFTEEQILLALKQGGAGPPIADVCRQMGISEATYYVWKKRYGNLGLLEVRELRQLRDENARLKRLVADLTLDRHVLQEVIKKRSNDVQTPGHRAMDTGLLPAERTPCVRAELFAERHVVLPLSGPRQQRPAAADSGAGDGTAAIRLRTAAHLADPGGLTDRPQPGPSAVQAGGPPGTYESAPAQAHQPAPRARSHRHGRGSVLGHGFRS
jgi:putative transposase